MYKNTSIPRATLGRLPLYLEYLKKIAPEQKTVSATAISRALGYGEVQVRKDLCAVSGRGKPRVGYVTEELIGSIDRQLSGGTPCRAVIVGAGKLGGALLGYDGFSSYGLTILAAFDADLARLGKANVLPMEDLESFCRKEKVRIGVITVPAEAAQSVCDRLVSAGIRAIWSFAPVKLSVPDGVFLREEDLALSLAHLRASAMAGQA